MIYLDHAAATPVSKKVLNSMLPFFSEEFMNPSAPYLPATQVREAYNEAKATIAHAVGGRPADLVITSGATESINLALRPFSNILVSAIEHPAVLASAKNPTIIKVKKTGLIDLADLRQKITPKTELISIALVNNELGTIQPLGEIAAIVKEERNERLKNNNKTPIFLHSDASQALNLLDLNVARIGVDLLTISSAKIYGPKGIGALWASHNVKLTPISHGGGQERGLRAGTENVPATIGFATAIKDAKAHINSERTRLKALQKILHTDLAKNNNIVFLGQEKDQLVSFLPITIPGLDAERLIMKLEKKQVYLSTGSACAAAKGQKSHVLEAIGLSESEITGSLRISLGKLNNEKNIKLAAKLILEAIAEEQQRLKHA